jgi:hypothetical protein
LVKLFGSLTLPPVMAGVVTGVVAGVVAGAEAAAVTGASAALELGTPGADAGAALAVKFIELGALRPDGNDAVEVIFCVAGVLSPAGSDAREVKGGVAFEDIRLGAVTPDAPQPVESPPAIDVCPCFVGSNRPSCWFCAATCDVKSSPAASPKPILK